MDEILFEVLKCVVIVACIAITRYVIPYFKEMATKENGVIVMALVQSAVQYAEQCFTDNEKKKDVVTEYMIDELNKRHITITQEQLNILIESAVYTLNQDKAKAIENKENK